MEATLIPNPKDNNATILLMGLRRSGKSSICKVVFHNMQPYDTLYLESTSKPTTEQFSSLIDLSVMELPGQLNYFEPNYDSERLFSSVGALVYVIDSQDEYLNAITNLSMIIDYAYKVNPKINIEVLIHKIDGLSEDYRIDAQRDIMQRTGDELLDLGVEGVELSFYLTSIFNHSIYEAFSRIVQKLIPEVSSLENMLDNLVEHSSIDKVFLFDVNSKIYVATDSSPVDIQTYEVCAEFIDITIDLDDLYVENDKNKNGNGGIGGKQKEVKSISHLSNGSVLYLKQMIRGLALVALIRNDDTKEIQQDDDNTIGITAENIQSADGSVFDSNQEKSLTVIDHNVNLFKKSLMKIWKNSKLTNVNSNVSQPQSIK
ncbi:GTP-binding protein, putative [Candida dubliniensis CD36]|uniref:GTP-binding protein n=1 Tax=Candida dubliniensis (strain CD36 / ATCC MYA-646 / CBS 7987 / NCPF 3949 / NRRL Y-17841) TaxID=573826 RepID=B9WLC0_CANDC|nr:GTP-binding protein, putative [Candida dubliniensis CD36]CAX39825.1 GTP-binding protein, putative [Candida dubliniensis CD36]